MHPHPGGVNPLLDDAEALHHVEGQHHQDDGDDGALDHFSAGVPVVEPFESFDL